MSKQRMMVGLVFMAIGVALLISSRMAESKQRAFDSTDEIARAIATADYVQLTPAPELKLADSVVQDPNDLRAIAGAITPGITATLSDDKASRIDYFTIRIHPADDEDAAKPVTLTVVGDRIVLTDAKGRVYQYLGISAASFEILKSLSSPAANTTNE